MFKTAIATAATITVCATMTLTSTTDVVAQDTGLTEQVEALREQLNQPGVTVREQGGYVIIHIPSQLTFATDQATLSPQIIPTLDDTARILQQYGKTGINVVGHTDSTGSAEYNLDLSQRRAESVTEHLLQQGISPERLSTQGVGALQPVASNDTAEGRAENRRVELQIFPDPLLQ